MPAPSRYADALASLPRDLGRWYRGRPSTSDTYLAMRHAHRHTAGYSTAALRTILRRVPGAADQLRTADQPRLSTTDDQAVTTLGRDGITTLEPLLDPRDVDALREFATRGPAAGSDQEGTPVRGTYEQLSDRARMLFLDGTFTWGRPEVQRLLASKRLWDLARAYFGMVPVVHPPQLYWSCAAPERNAESAPPISSRNFHWDYDGVGGLRLHLYLTDVDEAAAPMEYVTGSHRPGALRSRELRHADQGRAPESALDTLGLVERRSITGPAGTTFLSDSTGLHRATTPTGRDRLFLVLPVQAGIFSGYYSRRRLVPVRDERFARALEVGRPELRLFGAAPDHQVAASLA